MAKALVERVLSEQHKEDTFLAAQFAYEGRGSSELIERKAIADARWKCVGSGDWRSYAFQQLGESFALSEAGSGLRVEQSIVLAGANGSRNLGQHARLSRDVAGQRKAGRDNLESLNGGVQVTQNPIRN
jgi:hypothetical protein